MELQTTLSPSKAQRMAISSSIGTPLPGPTRGDVREREHVLAEVNDLTDLQAVVLPDLVEVRPYLAATSTPLVSLDGSSRTRTGDLLPELALPDSDRAHRRWPVDDPNRQGCAI